MRWLWVLLALVVATSAWSAGEMKFRLVADLVEFDQDGNQAQASGNAHFYYRDMELEADRIDANLTTKQVSATGQVTFTQGDRRLTGESLTYNLDTRQGSLSNARGMANQVIFLGQKIEVDQDQLIARQGMFTTCDRPQPHYRITAKEIVVHLGQYLIARKATVWVGKHRIFKVPWYRMGLAKREMEEFMPGAGYTPRDGAFVEVGYRPWVTPDFTGIINVRYGTERRLRGWAMAKYEPAWGGACLVASREEYPGERKTLIPQADALVQNIWVSRLPELALRSGPHPIGSRLQGDLSVSWGRYQEEGAAVVRQRTATLLQLGTKPLPLSSRAQVSLAGIYQRAWYQTKDSHSVLASVITLDTRPTDQVQVSVSYVHRTPKGQSPFLFDRVQIGQELAGDLSCSLGDKWRVRVRPRYDLRAGNFPDWNVTLTHVAHCLEYSATWHQLSQGVQLGVTLAGF